MGSDLEGLAAGDSFGHSVSISKDGLVVAVGSPQSDQNGDASGSTKVYSWNGSGWVQKGSAILGSSAGDQSGWSVSLDGTGQTVAVGSPQSDSNGLNSGKTVVYQWTGGSWVQKGSEIRGELKGDQSGYSTDISDDGNFLSVGAVYNDDAGASSGHVRFYDWNGSNWVLDFETPGEAPGDLSGFSVSGDGNVVAVGAVFNDGSGFNAGSVRVYKWNGSSWSLKGSEINGESAGDQSGFSVSVSGNGDIVVIGAPFNDGNGPDSGHARVYEWNGSSWVKKGSDIDGEFPSDASGHSVSTNEDGTIVAVGAIYNDGGGNNSGHVRVYEWKGSWVKIGSDIDGEGPEDQSGSGKSVSLSGDGRTVAIGAPYNDRNGSNSGQVRVFKYSN